MPSSSLAIARYYALSAGELLFKMRPSALIARIYAARLLKMQPPAGPHTIQPVDGLQLRARGVMDIWSIKETYIDRFYEVYGFPVQRGWTVVDIGGGIGDYTIFAARTAGRVLAFEPGPASLALLNENLRLNKVANVEAFPEAIWSSSGTLDLDVASGEPGQFISREAGEAPTQRLTVPCLTLEDAFARSGVQVCDLLKLDSEGAEYPILMSASDATLGRIRRMVMEYHDNAGPVTHRELAVFLQGKGYQVRSVPNVVHDYLGYLSAWRD